MRNLILSLLLITVSSSMIYGQQASLSLQGIIKNADGSAVDDGTYEITFKLYPNENAAAIWTEVQSDVEVKGGIYSALLGSVSGLPAFTQASYLLGVSIEGGIELQPRSQLTAAPFALSLIGDDNIFPNSGNVGIGTISPGVDLEVDGTAKVTDLEVDDRMAIGNATTDYAIAIKGLATNSNWLEFIDAGGASEWKINHKSGGLNFSESGVDDFRLFLDHGGNVGVGTDDPETKLHIIGGGDAGLSGDGYIMFGPKTSSNIVIDNNEIVARNNGAISALNLNYEGGNIVLGASNAITHKVAIGTTSPQGKFHIETTNLPTNEWAFVISNSSTSSYRAGMKLTNNGFLRITNNADNSGPAYVQLDSNGSWASSSDERLKENIVKASNFLAKVALLEPKNYNFKSNTKEDVDLGFIAQEVRKVYPELVSGEETDDEYLSVKYDGFGVVAIGAIKEQQEIIKAQNKRITDLETRLKNLENMMVMSASK